MGSELVPLPAGGRLVRFDDPLGSAEMVIEEWLEEADAEAAAIVERARQQAAVVRMDAVAQALDTLSRAEQDAGRIRREAAEAAEARLEDASRAAERLRLDGAAEARELVGSARTALVHAYLDLQRLTADLNRLFDPASAVLVSLQRANASMAAICNPGTPTLASGGGPLAELAAPREEAGAEVIDLRQRGTAAHPQDREDLDKPEDLGPGCPERAGPEGAGPEGAGPEDREGAGSPVTGVSAADAAHAEAGPEQAEDALEAEDSIPAPLELPEESSPGLWRRLFHGRLTRRAA